jgi:hypothetical protein
MSVILWLYDCWIVELTSPVGVRGEGGMGYAAKTVGFGVMSVVGDWGKGYGGQKVGEGRGGESVL